MLKYARANGCPWDEATNVLAAYHAHSDLFEWAQSNGCPSFTSKGALEEWFWQDRGVMVSRYWDLPSDVSIDDDLRYHSFCAEIYNNLLQILGFDADGV